LKRFLKNFVLKLFFREIFLKNREKYMDSMMTVQMTDHFTKLIKRGQKVYYSGHRTDFTPENIKFIRRESLKVCRF